MKITFILLFLIAFFATFGQTTETLYENGSQRLNQGDLSGAIIQFSNAINLNPKLNSITNRLCYWNRAEAKRRLNDFRGALNDFDILYGLFSIALYIIYKMYANMKLKLAC